MPKIKKNNRQLQTDIVDDTLQKSPVQKTISVTNFTNTNKIIHKPCILIICAHNDDQVLGVGGTIRRYIEKGYTVYTYIFSFGETSHPHLKPHIVIKMRTKEAMEAAEILGDTISFFGVPESNFEQYFDYNQLAQIILDKKPEKIFTHSPKDPHPDHKATFQITYKAAKAAQFKQDFFVFDIWNMFSFWDSTYPKLFIDVSDTFAYKVKAFSVHKSQFNTFMSLWWSIHLKAKLHGIANNCKYAELFHKIDIYDVDDYYLKKINAEIEKRLS